VAKRNKNTGEADAIPREQSTTRERLVWLLNNVWRGSRSAMASDLGFSHAAIVKIVQGEREPGRGMLASLAAHPKVNPKWLMHGEGEPLLDKQSQLSAAIWSRPISRDLLSAVPGETEKLAASDVFRLGAEESTYFYATAGNEPVALDEREKILPDDLFLMAPVPQEAHEDPRLLDGRICAVRRSTGTGSTLLLARIRCHLEQQGTSWRLTVLLPDVIPPRPVGRERVIQLDSSGDATGRPIAQKAAKMAESSTISPEDIMAVAVFLVRRP